MISMIKATCFFFRKSCRFWDNLEKHDRAREATDCNIIRCMRFACWVTKAKIEKCTCIYNRLPEDESSRSKHVEDVKIKKLKILIVLYLIIISQCTMQTTQYYHNETHRFWILCNRGSVRITRGLSPTMTARGQSIGISIGMLPQTLIMSRLDQLSQLGARI